jgi:hypothetical protein
VVPLNSISLIKLKEKKVKTEGEGEFLGRPRQQIINSLLRIGVEDAAK